LSLLRPVYLAGFLWFGACLAQQPAPSVPSQQTPAAPLPSATTPTSQSEDISGGLNRLQGVNVAGIQISGPAVTHPEWLESLVDQKVNQPLDKYKVRRSVQALFNTGRFADIQVEAERDTNGVRLNFVTRENYFYSSILVEGAPTRPNDSQLVNASRLALGELFEEAKVKAGMESMQRALQEGGYFQAAIQPNYEFDNLNQQVKVLFVVAPSQSARVGEVVVTGSSGMTEAEVRNITQLKAGRRVTPGQATRSLQRIRGHLQKRNFLEAQVTLTQRVYHPQSNSVDYTFEIDRGPVVDVKVEGAKLSRSMTKKLVPVFEENAVDDDLLMEGKRNIQDYFQTKGYFETSVDFTQRQTGEDRRDVIFAIEKGQRHKFVELTVRGNRYFRTDVIRERMETQPAGGVLQHGVFSQATLARDVRAIENLYRSNGFLAAAVTPEVQDNYHGQIGHIGVILTIVEGPQTTVGKLTIEGNSALSTDEIHDLIGAKEGQPYSDATVINDQTEVMNAYVNRGFPDVRFEYSTSVEPGDAHKIDLTYKITEGNQVFVNRVLINGLHFTRPFVVEREIKIRDGEPLSQREMLDSQNGLYNIGIFNEVGMAVQNPNGHDAHKNIIFQMSEARRYTFNYGFGLEVQTGQPAGVTSPQGKAGASPRGSFDITRLNFRGRNHTVTLKTRYGNLEKLALLGYSEPRFFDAQTLSLDLTAFYQQTNDVQTYTAKRLEGSAEIKQILSRTTTLLYRMIYRRVSTTNLVIEPTQVPLFSQPVRVGLPAFTYIRDTRDNPIDSHRGSFNTFDVGVASSIFGSETNFVRVVLQNSTYYQFHHKRWVFARSTRIGIEEPFAGTSSAIFAPGPNAPPPSSFIPLPERFLAGGSTSHRGFGVNQAGPRDLATGQPLGGEAMFINNLELRSPPVPFPFVGNNLSLVLFHDIGNVFTTPIDMIHSLFQFNQRNRAVCLVPTAGVCDFNYMSQAVGGGIRYKTPIGPLSFDLGYNLNPPAFPIGSPPSPGNGQPPPPPSSQVLRHINYFFNVGQTF
jgi:outer membrane protein assembly complex protein YaeT